MFDNNAARRLPSKSNLIVRGVVGRGSLLHTGNTKGDGAWWYSAALGISKNLAGELLSFSLCK